MGSHKLFSMCAVDGQPLNQLEWRKPNEYWDKPPMLLMFVHATVLGGSYGELDDYLDSSQAHLVLHFKPKKNGNCRLLVLAARNRAAYVPSWVM